MSKYYKVFISEMPFLVCFLDGSFAPQQIHLIAFDVSQAVNFFTVQFYVRHGASRDVLLFILCGGRLFPIDQTLTLSLCNW